MFYKRDVIRQKMNEAGRAGSPFLFGVTFEGEEGFFLPHPLSQQEVLFDIDGQGNAPTFPDRMPSFRFEAEPEPFTTYQKRFETVMHGLRRGDSYLTNLTISTPLRTSLTLEEVFLHSKARYRLLIPGSFVCFSPECFVTLKEGRIATFPMKGTIDASRPGAGEIILSDPKERAEHNTTVDLLRNDLSCVATEVNVKRFRYLDRVQTSKGEILQVSSEIEGTLPDRYREQLGSLLFKLLPAGSVSGAPKEATLRLIGAAEGEPRGYYCGVAGYYDGESLNTFVMIRFIEERGVQHFFRSGGGITAQSDSRSEYDEAIQKVYLPFQSS
ncbi:aminodeoxychorismate synthase component I [Dysgonomonadaceae bacterium zrk40]|nr:aminodeoxychorismate synthase component I [Dysgonomonadaceae bacterium zrk40]